MAQLLSTGSIKTSMRAQDSRRGHTAHCHQVQDGNWGAHGPCGRLAIR